MTLSLLHGEPNVMRRDDDAPGYSGSFVVLRPVELAFAVTLEPPLPGLTIGVVSFGCKSAAWGYARQLWTANRLPFKDFTHGGVGQTNARDGFEARKAKE